MSLERYLIIPDVHRPRHCKKSWSLLLKVAKVFHPDAIVILGDFGDFGSVSRHAKDPYISRELRREVQSCNEGLDDLDALGAAKKVYLSGNHENRLHRYLQEKAPELFDVVNIPDLLRLGARGWKHVPYMKDVKIGPLYFTHDVGTSGRYAAFKALDKYRHGAVSAHTHKMTYVVEGTLADEQQLSVILGWLGDVKQIDYTQKGKAIRDSALGFGVGYLDAGRNLFYIQPVPIVKGSCVVEGKLFR